MTNSLETPRPLPSWLYLVLALPTAALGLIAAGVSAFLFILGLEQTEGNEAAKAALTAIGLLLTAAELLAFFLPTLLQGRPFRAWRLALTLFGVSLITFQIATVTVTQRTLVAATDLTAQANNSRTTELRAQIDSLRNSAQQLRTVAQNYATSPLPAQRNRAQGAIKDAIAIEAKIPPLAAELAQVETQAKPTLSTVFESATEKTVFLGARASLVALTGILMFSLSGALIRSFLNTRRTEPLGLTAQDLSNLAHNATEQQQQETVTQAAQTTADVSHLYSVNTPFVMPPVTSSMMTWSITPAPMPETVTPTPPPTEPPATSEAEQPTPPAEPAEPPMLSPEPPLKQHKPRPRSNTRRSSMVNPQPTQAEIAPPEPTEITPPVPPVERSIVIAQP